MVIETKKQYNTALKKVQKLWDAEVDTPDGKKLSRLIADISVYESVNFLWSKKAINNLKKSKKQRKKK